MSDSPDRSKKGIAAGLLGAAAAAYTAKKEHDYQEDQEKYGDKAERSKKEFVAGAIAAAGLGYAAKKEVDHHKEENAYEAQQEAKKAASSGGYGSTKNNNNNDDDDNKEGMSTKAKVGIALGAVAGIGAAVAGGVAIKKHLDSKNEQQQQQQQHAQGQNQGQGQSYGTAGAVSASSSGDNRVRYGSRIALKHNMTGRFLSFGHAAPNSNSSGQKLTYAGDWQASDEDWWVVTGGNNGDCVQFGATIRLKHAATGHHLHSHNGHRSPCSGQQEVTAFNGADSNDDWVVERWGGGGGEWLREEPSFSLRHSATGGKLHSHDQKVGGDLNEVTVFNAGGVDENDRWRAIW